MGSLTEYVPKIFLKVANLSILGMTLMSGHSKWSTIKRQKGATDQKRGQLFTKLAQAITLAVIAGGGVSDPASNFKLRLTIEKAREANMPKDNIERAIMRATESSGKTNFQEVLYEGYGPGGVAILVEAATDNRARTYADIKNIFNRGGGDIAGPGAVSFLFEQKGLLTIPTAGRKKEEIELVAIDSGAQDVEEVGENILVYTDSQNLAQVKKQIEEANLTIRGAELTMMPKTIVEVANIETAHKILALIELLEDLDDVQNVHTNFEISDDILSSI